MTDTERKLLILLAEGIAALLERHSLKATRLRGAIATLTREISEGGS